MPTPPHSKELTASLDHARRLAALSVQPISSSHVLLGLFAHPNKARALLVERHLDEARVQAALRAAVMPQEPAATIERLCQRASDVAHNVGARDVDSLHLIVAISRSKECDAYRALERTGTSLTTLRHVAVAHMTGSSPRRSLGLGPRRRNHAPQALHHHARLGHDDGTDGGQPMPAPVPHATQAAHLHEAADGAEDGLGAPHHHAWHPGLEPPDGLGGAAQRSPAESRQNIAHNMTRLPLDELAPTLAECGIDLTAQARSGHIDAAIARDKELEALADVLGKRRANNPVLVGPPGVGKTAIVEGLALLWAMAGRSARGPGGGQGSVRPQRRIVALDTGAMVAGTSLRGSFSERLGAIKNEVAQAKGHIVVFIDELHMLIGAGASGEGPQDAAGELKAALARGEFPCIGATTEDEYKRYIEKDPALERRFTAIQVQEPSCEQACRIVHGAISPYAQHHGVKFTDDAIDAAVMQTHRFVAERKLPDKAFAALDLAGSRAHRSGASTVTRIDVAQVVHEWTHVPLERLATADAARFAQAEKHLSQQLIGHGHVVEAVARSLRRGFAGFNAKRPMGSFLFLGPTGVGKTEMVKVLADFVFGQRDSIVRFDMSELVEKHAVARLLGAQPGYVGYEEGGQLTEALRKRPFQIVLFDEIEKAHPEVINVLLQILDEGHLTDTQGRRISFAHTVVVLTSNLGAEAALKPQSIGFGGSPLEGSFEQTRDDALTQNVLNTARDQLSPELWSRLDEHLVFLPLSQNQVSRIAVLQLQRKALALEEEHKIRLTWDVEVIDLLLQAGGFNPRTGARGLRKTIAKHIETPMADLILFGQVAPLEHIHLVVQDNKVHLLAR